MSYASRCTLTFTVSSVLALVSGCDPPRDESEANSSLPEPKIAEELVFDPGPEPGAEAYICVAVPIDDAGAAQIDEVMWFPPTGAVRLHHATLYGARGDIPSGPIPCDALPELVATLGVYTPGEEPLTFPPGVTVQLPENTSHLYFVAHVFRVAEGRAEPTRVELGVATTPAPHAAQWVDVFADVPPLPPHETQSAVGSCRFEREANIITVWAHMHQHGRSFEGTIVRADGSREPLIAISDWDFDYQPLYPVSVRLEPGDSVETRCEWTNDTDQEVLPGPFTHDEMCNQGLFVWPAEGARCVPSTTP